MWVQTVQSPANLNELGVINEELSPGQHNKRPLKWSTEDVLTSIWHIAKEEWWHKSLQVSPLIWVAIQKDQEVLAHTLFHKRIV